ncbi:MAG: hypothetical protein ACO1NX_01080 [Chitinophagaceae bacterium]
MKNLCFLFLLFLSFHSFAQNVSGFYSGTLYNDTTKHTQQYELALSDYRGKVTGWAYATFIANDTFYYSIRRVKGVVKGANLIIEDGEMIANNFPKGPDKGVRRITQIPVSQLGDADTLGNFKATWRTTATREFYSLPGTMAMERRSDSSQSALFAHLTEMRLMPTQNAVATASTKEERSKAAQKEKETFEKEKPKNTTSKNTTTANKKTTTAAAPDVPAVIPYTERAQKVLQTFEVASDSLILSFYDNGVVDGDIISVYVNGENLVSNAKLLEVATKKTVHLSNINSGEITIVLVAETLGEMPPNTGLLVVQDGANRYEVRFSADLQTNAALIFKKRN